MKTFKQDVHNWWNDFIHRIKNKGKDEWSVICDGTSLVIEKNELEISRIGFDAIIRITAYRKDLLTYDPVYLCFTSKEGCNFEIWEDMTGFNFFISEELNKYFHVEPDWLIKVNNNTFTENRHVIWKA